MSRKEQLFVLLECKTNISIAICKEYKGLVLIYIKHLASNFSGDEVIDGIDNRDFLLGLGIDIDNIKILNPNVAKLLWFAK